MKTFKLLLLFLTFPLFQINAQIDTAKSVRYDLTLRIPKENFEFRPDNDKYEIRTIINLNGMVLNKDKCILSSGLEVSYPQATKIRVRKDKKILFTTVICAVVGGGLAYLYGSQGRSEPRRGFIDKMSRSLLTLCGFTIGGGIGYSAAKFLISPYIDYRLEGLSAGQIRANMKTALDIKNKEW